MFSINKEIEYALLALSCLLKSKEKLSITSICKKTKIPQRFLARIFAKLVISGILSSVEGRNGGYTLTKRFYKITLKDFFLIFEKNIVNFDCRENIKNCKFGQMCSHKKFISKNLETQISKILKNTLLCEVFK